MKRSVLTVISSLALSFSLGALLSLNACQAVKPEAVAAVPLVKRDFEHVLVSEGALVPTVQETLNIPRRVYGSLEMLLPEGQFVKKGTVVARVSTREANERMASFSERFENERAELMKQRAEMPLERLKIQSEVKAKERDAKIAQLDLQTTREGPRLNERVQAKVNVDVPTLQQSAYPLDEKEALYAKGYLAEQELLEARLENERLKTQIETAELALKQQSQGYRQPEIHAAELKARSAQLEARISKLNAQAQQGLLRTKTRNQGSRVQNFERRSSSMQERLNAGELRAPIDGVVLYPLIWGSETPYVGMQVWGGLPVVQVAKTDKLRIETRINEFDIPHVKAGQSVTLTSPAFPGKVFPAKVTKVQKLAKYKDENKPVGLKYFDVEIALDKQAPELKANMTLTVNINVQTLKQVWVAPLEAVSTKEANKSFLNLEQNGDVVEREVKVLARSDNFVALDGSFSGNERLSLEAGGDQP